ncbi:MAG: insulinase family protein [Desulfovibrio sp.]|jgi:zinc protease|nr:insulinase family protein [Desulfovibrio sp.]
MRLFIHLITGLLMTVYSVFPAAAQQPPLQGEARPAAGAAGAESPADDVFSEGAHPVRRLANGLTVLVLPDRRFPLVSMRLYVHAGSAYEQPEEAGISHMLEHMVFKGTEKRPRGQAAADVEKAGGYLNAATSFDYTVYIVDMTREHWKTGLDVLRDMAFHPSLDPAELEAEKDVVIAELKRGEDDPGRRLFRMTQEQALRGTPYERPIIGFESTVRALSAEKIRAYIDRLYQPQSMLLVLCGDVDAEEAFAEADTLFGKAVNTRGVTSPRPVRETPPPPFGISPEEGPWNKVYLSLALPAPGMGDARSPRLDVLAHILGGDAGSRLPRLLKYEKRLADSVSVACYSFERLGMLYIHAVLDEDKLERFWKELCRELAATGKNGFTNEELARAVLNLEDDLYRSRETLGGYASKLGYFAFFDRGEQGEADYLRALRETTPAMLTEAAREFLNPDLVRVALLLPESDPSGKPESAAPGKPAGSPSGKNAGETPEGRGEAWKTRLAAALKSAWPSPAKAAKKGGQTEQAASGATEVLDLGKGRTLVLIPDRTMPYAAVNMLFSGGDALPDEKDQGLAAFTAGLLTKGTKRLNAVEVEDFLADRAATFSASSGRRSFSLHLESPARFTEDMFGLLSDTLVTPSMKEDEAARVRENQIAAVVMREDMPTGLAFRRMFPFFFKNHPYGRLQLGEKERIASFKAKDAREFWRKQTLRPWTLSVCGTFDRAAIIAAAQKLPVPAAEEYSVPEPVWGADKQLVLRLPERRQAHLFMVFPTSGRGAADEAGLDLLENILSGQSGLLFRDLRDEQGLGYTVTAMSWKAEKTGALIFYIGTGPDTLERCLEGFRKITADLRDKLLPEAELERGKNLMTGDYYRGRQSLDGRGAEAASLVSLHLQPDYARKLVEQSAALTAADLRELARRYLDPERAYLIEVLP